MGDAATPATAGTAEGHSEDSGTPASPVDALRAADPILARLIDRAEPVDMATWRARWSMDRFDALARVIVGQQIATAAASAIFGRLKSFIGDRDPAAAIAGASDADLRTIGLSANKAASLRDLAQRTLDGRLQLDRLSELTDEEAEAQLTAVRGIGKWTADLFLLGQLGRPDILPAADLGIRHAVQDAYGLDQLPSEGEVRRIGEAWRPYRSLATAYLYGSLWAQRRAMKDRAAGGEPPKPRIAALRAEHRPERLGDRLVAGCVRVVVRSVRGRRTHPRPLADPGDVERHGSKPRQ
jgi:DNA-3-methyladenine glycosylase II